MVRSFFLCGIPYSLPSSWTELPMDPNRFDAFARSFAGTGTRRSLLKRLSGVAAAAAALATRPTEAEPNPTRCRGAGTTCRKHSECCSDFCGPKDRTGRKRCGECASGIVCGDICCPPEAVNACAVIQGPNGPVATCLCPCGTRYDAQANSCRRIDFCESDVDCCDGTCCNGICCTQGQLCCEGSCEEPGSCTCSNDDGCPNGLRCCSGQCKKLEDCVCPDGTGCSGIASCTRCDDVYSSDGLCCEYPNQAFCCTDSSANAGDGFVTCCIPGVDCPECPVGSGSGTSGKANVQDCLVSGGSFDDCCRQSTPGGEAVLSVPCCVVGGQTCQEAAPCCADCDGGLCTCYGAGIACPRGTECCIGLVCLQGVCRDPSR